MKLFVWKYTDPNNTYYFDTTSNSFVYNDFIVVQSILKFPEFNDEFNCGVDFNEKRVGDYDVEFSMAQEEKSVNGKYIGEFFFPTDNKNYKYLVISEPKKMLNQTDGYMRRCGFITQDTLEKNIEKFTITFKVIGAIGEFSNFNNQKYGKEGTYISDLGNPLIDDQRNWDFDNWIQNDFFGVNARYTVLNKLDWKSKIGFVPKVSQPLLYELVSTTNPLSITKWEAFKNMAAEMGFCYMIIPDLLQDYSAGYCSFPRLQLVLFWRSQGITTTNLELMNPQVYKYAPLYVNEWLQLMNRSEKWNLSQAGGTDIVIDYGLVARKKEPSFDVYNYDTIHNRETPQKPYFLVDNAYTGIYYDPKDNNLHLSIVKKNICEPSINLYDFGGKSKNCYFPQIATNGINTQITDCKISFARIFVKPTTQYPFGYDFTKAHPLLDPIHYMITSYNDSGNSDILFNSFLEYRFLITGVSLTQICDIHYNMNVPLNIGMKTTLPPENKNYMIIKINNLNIEKNSAKVTFQEIIT
jgi:hypothetical protein